MEQAGEYQHHTTDMQSDMASAVDLVRAHQKKRDRDVLGGVAVDPDHPQHRRVVTRSERDLELAPVNRDVDRQRGKNNGQDGGIECRNR